MMICSLLLTCSMYADIASKSDIPNGYEYYSEVVVFWKTSGQSRNQRCTVVRGNMCGNQEYRIYFCKQWYPVTRNGSEYSFFEGGRTFTFRM